MRLVVGQASAPRAGEWRSGDAVWVRSSNRGAHAFAVVDALGHGPEAERVARLAIACLDQEEEAVSAVALSQRLHRALAGTRGAAACVVRIDNDLLDACSVGNVDLRAEGVRIPVVLSPGVLGGHVRHFLRFEAHIGPGARIAIFSDGLSSRFSLSDTRELTPQEACDRLLAAHRHHHDDSTVLIIDFED